jgi:hypothetical protein
MTTMRRLHVFAVLIFLMLFSTMSAMAYSPHEHTENQPGDSANIEKVNTVKNNFYVGAKVGLVFLLGLEMNYIMQTHGTNRFYLAVAAQSSLIINSANAGGGIFLGKTGIGVGCRYHHLLWFESEKESKIQPGYGPEIIYNKTIGTKYIINLHAGGIVTKGSFFPDISFGIFLPLN